MNVASALLDVPHPTDSRSLGLEPVRESPLPAAEELFRAIYTRAGLGGAAEIIGVTSAIAGEGRSTVALGVATTLAQDFPDSTVLLIETDLARPVLAADFGIEPTPGLAECLVSGQPFQTACRPTFQENLNLLPVGEVAGGSGRILRSSRMTVGLQALRDSYDFVILDLPAILVNCDAVLLAELADSIIFVTRAGVTPTHLVNRALAEIDDSKLRGLVLNGTQSAVPGWLRRLCGL